MGRPTEIIDPNIGSRIRMIRERMKTKDGKKVTREIFAEYYDVSVQAVSYWENGKRKVPMYVIEDLAENLGIDKNFILCKYDDPHLTEKLKQWDAQFSKDDVEFELKLIDCFNYILKTDICHAFDEDGYAEFIEEVKDFITFKYNRIINRKEKNNE